MSTEEAAQLAAEDPTAFNSKWEAARRAERNPIKKEDDR
jgi:hypothetical protein